MRHLYRRWRVNWTWRPLGNAYVAPCDRCGLPFNAKVHRMKLR